MPVTEVKQTVIQKLAEIKKGGKSDTEVDRKEEVEAILKFAQNAMNCGEIEQYTPDERIELFSDLLSALFFMKENCSDDKDLKKIIKEIKNIKKRTEVSPNEKTGASINITT